MSARMAQTLYERRTEVVSVEFVSPCPDGWSPIPNRCHDNARVWVTANPGWEVVHGWLLISDHVDLGTVFDAHSVVRADSGQLWDVTQNQVHRFLLHEGSAAEYARRVESGEWVRLTHIPGFE